jgi:hypothetical protein
MRDVCASGGYNSCAAQSDLLIKAFATVSAACVAFMTRNGGALHEINTENREASQAAAAWRTSNAEAESVNEAPKHFQHERSDQTVQLMSYDMMVTYDSFQFQHLIAPRPLLMVARNEANTLHCSESAVEKAGEPKELFVVRGQTHLRLYDDLEVAGSKVVEFSVKALE